MANANARAVRTDANELAPIVDRTGAAPSGAAHVVSIDGRASEGAAYRIRALTVEFADASGGWTRYVVPSRNISRAGLSVLTNQYVYPKTRCLVHLLSIDNQRQAVPASVVRCRYLPGTGRLHEVGLRFETAVDLSQFYRGASECRILLCDDDPIVHQIVPRLLNQMNVHIVSARNGEEAVRAATADRFDIVLMDADMPGVDGTQAVNELRRRGFARPIVALTTLSDPATLRSCLKSGYTQIGSRPFTRESLTALVKSLQCEPIVSEFATDSALAQRIGAFITGLPEEMRTIEMAFAITDLAGMQSIVRRVRDGSGACGFDIIGIAADELDVALRASSDSAELRDRLSQLSKLCHAARTAPTAGYVCEHEAALRN